MIRRRSHHHHPPHLPHHHHDKVMSTCSPLSRLDVLLPTHLDLVMVVCSGSFPSLTTAAPPPTMGFVIINIPPRQTHRQHHPLLLAVQELAVQLEVVTISMGLSLVVAVFQLTCLESSLLTSCRPTLPRVPPLRQAQLPRHHPRFGIRTKTGCACFKHPVV